MVRERIARLLILLAFALLVGDLAWSLRRLAPTLLPVMVHSLGAVLLEAALLLLVAAWALRSKYRG